MRLLVDQARRSRLPAFIRNTPSGQHDRLRAAEEAAFDVLLTTDNNLAFQQNLTGRKIAIVVLSRNRWRMVQRMIPKIVSAANGATPGSYVLVEVPVR